MPLKILLPDLQQDRGSQQGLPLPQRLPDYCSLHSCSFSYAQDFPASQEASGPHDGQNPGKGPRLATSHEGTHIILREVCLCCKDADVLCLLSVAVLHV